MIQLDMYGVVGYSVQASVYFADIRLSGAGTGFPAIYDGYVEPLNHRARLTDVL